MNPPVHCTVVYFMNIFIQPKGNGQAKVEKEVSSAAVDKSEDFRVPDLIPEAETRAGLTVSTTSSSHKDTSTTIVANDNGTDESSSTVKSTKIVSESVETSCTNSTTIGDLLTNKDEISMLKPAETGQENETFVTESATSTVTVKKSSVMESCTSSSSRIESSSTVLQSPEEGKAADTHEDISMAVSDGSSQVTTMSQVVESSSLTKQVSETLHNCAMDAATGPVGELQLERTRLDMETNVASQVGDFASAQEATNPLKEEETSVSETKLLGSSDVAQSSSVIESSSVIKSSNVTKSSSVIQTSSVIESSNIVESSNVDKSTNVMESSNIIESSSVAESSSVKKTSSVEESTSVIGSSQFLKDGSEPLGRNMKGIVSDITQSFRLGPKLILFQLYFSFARRLAYMYR